MVARVEHEPNDHKDFFTVRQIADRWDCSEKKVRRVIGSGELVVHRFGDLIRVSHQDLMTYERIKRLA